MSNKSTSVFKHGQLSKTSSRCLTDMVTVTHDFEVTNYRQLDGQLGAGKYVSSSTFSVAGCNWNIRFYPDGSNSKENGDGNASVFLYHLNPATDVRTQFTFCLDVCIGRLGIILSWISNTQDIDIDTECQYFCLDVLDIRYQTRYWSWMPNAVWMVKAMNCSPTNCLHYTVIIFYTRNKSQIILRTIHTTNNILE
jgi:hypothetical protein